MGILVGPTPWWQANLVSASPEGTCLPDGSTIICKSGGTAWIVAPQCTRVRNISWGNYATEGNTVQGNLPQITPTIWTRLYNRLISCGFNPDDWFVPSISQLQNPGYVCRSKWDFETSCGCYSSSTEINATSVKDFVLFNNAVRNVCKCYANANQVRAFRCVTY
jgi:hypothetical protein